MNEENILEIKTEQSKILKVLFEVLKDVLANDINISFTSEGMTITEMNATEEALVYLKLDAKSFNGHYYCQNNIVAAIDPVNFFKIMKIATNDTISFYIKKNDPELFYVCLENIEKKRSFESCVRLLDKPNLIYSIPDVEFDSEILLPSPELQKICRNLNSLGSQPVIEIKSVNDKLIFAHQGDFSKQKIVYSQSTELEFDKESSQVIQGKFNLKFLLLFTKATELCKHVKIYLKNDFALILEYSVGNLGKVMFLLNNLREE